MDYVYVLDRKGKPLMPTKRFGRVRKLLKSGKAVPVSSKPFVIRLKYDVPGFVQPIHEGIDPGRENIGDAASLENGENVWLCNIRTNNRTIKLKMQDRSGFRQERRRHDRQGKQRKAFRDETTLSNGQDDIVRSRKSCKSVQISYPGAENPVTHKVIRGKEGKFNNRKRDENWLTPSARQLIQIIISEIEQTAKILPISHIHFERSSFDFQKMENENIHNWQYGKGPLYGFKSYKDCINQSQHGICALCGQRRIAQYHHIMPQKDGKWDCVKNIVGLCDNCHKAVHNSLELTEELKGKVGALRQKYQIGLLNSVIPALIEKITEYCQSKGISFVITDGKETSATRSLYGLPKDHCSDAYAISLCDREPTIPQLSNTVYLKRRFKKKSKNIISARNQRLYLLDGRIVARNRHKAMNQKEDSLEEFMAKHDNDPKLFANLEIRPAKRTYTYRKNNLVPPAHPGDLIRYFKRNKIDGQVRTFIFPAVSVKYADMGQTTDDSREWKIGIDDKKIRKAKFCKPIASGCLQIVDIIETSVHFAKLEQEALKRAA